MHDHSQCIKSLDAAKKALEQGKHAEGRAHVGRAMAALKGKKPADHERKLVSRLKSMSRK